MRKSFSDAISGTNQPPRLFTVPGRSRVLWSESQRSRSGNLNCLYNQRDGGTAVTRARVAPDPTVISSVQS